MTKKLLLLLLIPVFSQAQIRNFRKTTLDSLRAKTFTGSVAMSMSYTKDSDKSLILYTDVSLLYPDAKNIYSFASSLKYNTFYDDKSDSSNRYYASANVILFDHSLFENKTLKENFVAPELFSFYQYDENQGLKQRFQIGGNAAFKVVRSKNIRLNSGVGLFYEFERWRMLTEEQIDNAHQFPDPILDYIKELYDMDSDFNVIRRNVRAQLYLSSHATINKKLDFDFMFSIQQPFKPPFEGLPEGGPFPVVTELYPRYTFECLLSYKFTKKLSAQATFYFQHDKGHVSTFASDETINFVPSLSYKW